MHGCIHGHGHGHECACMPVHACARAHMRSCASARARIYLHAWACVGVWACVGMCGHVHVHACDSESPWGSPSKQGRCLRGFSRALPCRSRRFLTRSAQPYTAAQPRSAANLAPTSEMPLALMLAIVSVSPLAAASATRLALLSVLPSVPGRLQQTPNLDCWTTGGKLAMPSDCWWGRALEMMSDRPLGPAACTHMQVHNCAQKGCTHAHWLELTRARRSVRPSQTGCGTRQNSPCSWPCILRAAHLYKNVCTRACMHVCMCTCTCAGMHVRPHVCVCTCACARVHVCPCVCP